MQAKVPGDSERKSAGERQRQTLSHLRALFGSRGIMPRHQFGQNFLIDLNLHELIIRAADVGPRDVVLEVGPGAGALTILLARHAAAVVAVEIDPAMAALASETVAEFATAQVLNIDALASKHRIDPRVCEAIEAKLAEDGDRRLKLVANLPFNAATPLLTNLLIHPRLRPERIVVTIQREVADRLLAEPATSAYGALSILVRALADVELVRVLPPAVFWPRPKVDSAIVSIVPNEERRRAIADLPWFHAVVRRVFQHRRKNLRGVLAGIWGDHWTKPEVDAFLQVQGLDGQLRGEALNIEEWLALADALKARLAPDAVRETLRAMGAAAP
jgi:16S rRNA (adenine1518-N6/adenine1519-N6)-dimethyltransferase